MDGMTSGSVGPNEKAGVPDPEVTAKAKRRRFTPQYKLRILREADALVSTGGVGELLRREGLYSSHLSTWRRERERGELAGLGEKKRGRKADPDRALRQENERLARQVARLEKRLEQAEAIIDVQKKPRRPAALPEERETPGFVTLGALRGERPLAFWWTTPLKNVAQGL